MFRVSIESVESECRPVGTLSPSTCAIDAPIFIADCTARVAQGHVATRWQVMRDSEDELCGQNQQGRWGTFGFQLLIDRQSLILT